MLPPGALKTPGWHCFSNPAWVSAFAPEGSLASDVLGQVACQRLPKPANCVVDDQADHVIAPRVGGVALRELNQQSALNDDVFLMVAAE